MLMWWGGSGVAVMLSRGGERIDFSIIFRQARKPDTPRTDRPLGVRRKGGIPLDRLVFPRLSRPPIGLTKVTTSPRCGLSARPRMTRPPNCSVKGGCRWVNGKSFLQASRVGALVKKQRKMFMRRMFSCHSLEWHAGVLIVPVCFLQVWCGFGKNKVMHLRNYLNNLEKKIYRLFAQIRFYKN